MKAIQYSQFGGPEVLELVDLPDPTPGPGQIRVAVRAAGVNPIDWKLRSGMRGGDLPQTTGREVAGVVDALGEGVTDVTAGDEVFGFAAGGGGAAELLCPRTMRRSAIARLRRGRRPPGRVETAVRTLDLLGVRAGTTLLVNGAAARSAAPPSRSPCRAAPA